MIMTTTIIRIIIRIIAVTTVMMIMKYQK